MALPTALDLTLAVPHAHSWTAVIRHDVIYGRRNDRHHDEPGGVRCRSVNHRPGLARYFARQSRGRVRRRKFDAVCRQAIQGRVPDEAREIMVEEYRKVGQEPPGQPILDRRVDMLLAPRAPVNGVTDLVEGVSLFVGAATRFKKLLEGPTDSERQDMHRSDLFLKPDWHHTCQVELVDDAQSWIGDVPLTGLISYRDLSLITVNVQATAPPR